MAVRFYRFSVRSYLHCCAIGRRFCPSKSANSLCANRFEVISTMPPKRKAAATKVAKEPEHVEEPDQVDETATAKESNNVGTKKGRATKAAKKEAVPPKQENGDANPVKKGRGKKAALPVHEDEDDEGDEVKPAKKGRGKVVEKEVKEDEDDEEQEEEEEVKPARKGRGKVAEKEVKKDEEEDVKPAKKTRGKVAEKEVKKDEDEEEEEEVKPAKKARGKVVEKELKEDEEDEEVKPAKKARGKKAEKVEPEEVPEEPKPVEKKQRGRKAAPKKQVKEPSPELLDETMAEEPEPEPEPEEPKVESKRGKRAPKKAKAAEEEPVEEEEEAEEPVVKKSRGAPKRDKPEGGKAPMNPTETDYESIDFSSSKQNRSGKTANFKISSWNVDGIRAWLKKDGLKFISYEKPDVLCLQETKCSDDQILDEMKEVDGYKLYWQSSEKDGYAGVALFSKQEPLKIEYGIGEEDHDTEGRCITAEYEKVYIVCVYVPNAGRKLVTLPKRLEWNKSFKDYIKKLDEKKPVIICGDMNVAHNEIDLANPKTNTKNAGFTKEEREGLTEFLQDGYIDTYRELYPDASGAYTFWTYMMKSRSKNVGWRLDYFIASERLKDNICDNVIRSEVFGSDHCPITLTMNI